MKPMLELLNRSPSDHAHVIGPVAPIKDIMPAQGFTAVNVLDRRQPSLPSENMSKEPAHPSDRPGLAATSADRSIEVGQQSRKSSGRNDSVLCSEPAIKQSPDTAKRKRSIAESIEPVGSGSQSPTELAPSKRRMTESSSKEHSNTPDELLSMRDSSDRLLSRRLSTEFMNRDRGSRERSPVPTRHQRVAPPQVRPETEAHLAESLATHLQGVENDSTTGDGQGPAGINSYNDLNSDSYNPDDNGADPTGKRKRNFSNRVKTGCHTCRNRKKKCDETKPTCTNCLRGGFGCLGYGPKPVGTKAPNTGNRAIYMQSKGPDPPQEPDRTLSSDGPRYHHWGRMPLSPTTQDVHNRYPQPHSPVETRRSSSRDWTTHPYQHQRDPSYPFNSVPHTEYGHSIPPMSMYPSEAPPARDPWPHHNLPPYRSLPGPAAPTSLSSSIPPSTSHLPSSSPSEREKMLLGKPYLAFQDPTLRADTFACAAAIEAWTTALRAPHASSPEHRSHLLAAVFDPALRPGGSGSGASHHDTNSAKHPPRIGHRVVIAPPFAADYGYNVLLGDDVAVGPRCHFQDPCEISIGARTHVDAGVTFAGNAVPRAADGASAQATGSQAALAGGPIVVEEDVWIGAGVVVEACRVLGRGCVVRAGAVVARNVPAYTEVAGNPARIVRRLPRPGEGGGEPVAVAGEPVDPEIRRENEEILGRMRARRGWRE